jgi:hypothetical protein
MLDEELSHPRHVLPQDMPVIRGILAEPVVIEAAVMPLLADAWSDFPRCRFARHAMTALCTLDDAATRTVVMDKDEDAGLVCLSCHRGIGAKLEIAPPWCVGWITTRSPQWYWCLVLPL